MTAYDALASVYEWLVPDPLLTPEGSADVFAGALAALPPGARVLDCAAGTGELAVGLALRGFDVTASDASPAMAERAGALAQRRGLALPVVVCRWDELPTRHRLGTFDAVLCVGNSLAHAGPRQERRTALRGMAAVLRPGGLLVVTSRNWERVRARGSRLEIADRLVERHGRRGLVLRGWTIGAGWDDPHHQDVAVAFAADDGAVTTHTERLTFWPFRHESLAEDLRDVGLIRRASTYAEEAERYLVSARRASPGVDEPMRA